MAQWRLKILIWRNWLFAEDKVTKLLARGEKNFFHLSLDSCKSWEHLSHQQRCQLQISGCVIWKILRDGYEADISSWLERSRLSVCNLELNHEIIISEKHFINRRKIIECKPCDKVRVKCKICLVLNLSKSLQILEYFLQIKIGCNCG